MRADSPLPGTYAKTFADPSDSSPCTVADSPPPLKLSDGIVAIEVPGRYCRDFTRLAGGAHCLEWGSIATLRHGCPTHFVPPAGVSLDAWSDACDQPEPDGIGDADHDDGDGLGGLPRRGGGHRAAGHASRRSFASSSARQASKSAWASGAKRRNGRAAGVSSSAPKAAKSRVASCRYGPRARLG